MLMMTLDSCFEQPSVALLKDGALLGEVILLDKQKAVEQLVPSAITLLKSHNYTFEEITHYAATIGPGGFTAVRLAMLAAKGMATAHQTPTIALTSLQAMAYAALEADGNITQLTTALNAARGQCYTQSFSNQNGYPEAQNTPQLQNYADIIGLKAHPVITNAVANLPASLFTLPMPACHAGHVALLAQHAIQLAVELPPLTTPLHLRDADAKPGKAPLMQANMPQTGAA